MRRHLLTLTLSLAAASCASPPEPAAEVAELRGPSAKVSRERGLALLPSVEPGAQPTDADRAIASLQERAKKNPAKSDLWVALGRAWAKRARDASDPRYYLQADACAQVALDLDPNSPLARDLRGLVLLSDHRFQEAKALAEQVIARRPDDPMAWGTLSDAQLELGEFSGAIAAAQKMVSLKPNLPAYSRAAYLRWLQGDAKGAIAMERLAIDAAGSGRDVEPRDFAICDAATMFWHQGDYDGAEAGYRMALAERPGYPPALVGVARVKLARGDGKGAAELLDQAWRASPLAETAWLLGDAREMAGDQAGAEEAWLRLALDGRRGDRRTYAQLLSAKQRDPARALALTEEEARGRGDVYTRDAHAFALYRAGRIDEARRESDRARELGTRDARLLFHAGAIRLAAGETASGRALLEQALALNPAFDRSGAAEARRLLGTVEARR